MFSSLVKVPFDREKLSVKYGFFVDSDTLFIPFTQTEYKLMDAAKYKESLLDDEDKRTMTWRVDLEPFWFGMIFGTLGVLSISKMDNKVNEQNTKKDVYNENNEKTQTKEEEKIKKSVKNFSKKSSTSEQILSQKKLKQVAEASKFDYNKASTSLKEPRLKNISIGRSPFKTALAFSFFGLLGIVNGACRSRVNLYNLSLKYEDRLESYAPVKPYSSYTWQQSKSKQYIIQDEKGDYYQVTEKDGQRDFKKVK